MVPTIARSQIMPGSQLSVYHIVATYKGLVSNISLKIIECRGIINIKSGLSMTHIWLIYVALKGLIYYILF